MGSLWGTEMANYALVNMKIGQLAVHIADNASRIGDTSTLENRRIYESDINDLLLGANIQAGGLDFFKHGRAIVSSLETDPESGNQYIHWQRCRGVKHFASLYGSEGAGLDGSLAGMGVEGDEITADPEDAVIFVEVRYDYQPLISGYLARNSEIAATAAFTVRDSRDLSQIYQRDESSPDAISDCATYTDYDTIIG